MTPPSEFFKKFMVIRAFMALIDVILEFFGDLHLIFHVMVKNKGMYGK